MNINRSDLRRALLSRGGFDLGVREDVIRLDRLVVGYDRWFQSSVATLVPVDLKMAYPKQMLDRVTWMNSDSPKVNEAAVLLAISRTQKMRFFGPGALLASLAFAKQTCIRQGWYVHHVMASNLITHDLEEPLGPSPQSLVIVDTSIDEEKARMFIESRARLQNNLQTIRGASIYINSSTTGGPIDRELIRWNYQCLVRKVGLR